VQDPDQGWRSFLRRHGDQIAGGVLVTLLAALSIWLIESGAFAR
jgi:hypothetical protein